MWRRLAVAALLPAETLLLTLNFEPVRLEATARWAATLVEHSSVLLRIAIAMAGTLALVLSSRAAELWVRYGSDPRPHPWEWTVLHLACFAGFYQQTGWLFAGGSGGPEEWHIASWAALCLAVGVSWCIALAPARAWREFVLAERRPVLASLVAGIVVWGFGLLAQRYWQPMADWTLFFAYGVLRTVYANVEYDAAEGTVGTPALLIEIAPECSGYEGVALVTVFVAVYLWLFRRRVSFPSALWLLPAGILAMWVANVLRIAAIVAVGTSISPRIAVQGFHSQAGWIAFTVIALGLIWVSHSAGWVIKAELRPEARSSPAAPALLVPFVVMLATSMVTAAFSDGLDALYPVVVVATAAALYRFRKSYRDFPFGFSAVSIGIGVAVYLAWIALGAVLPPDGSKPGTALPDLPATATVLWIVFRVIGSVVTVPMAEELAFRGYLLRKLVASDFEQVPPTRFTWLSFLGSSILFGLMHQSGIAGAVAGAGFALAVYHRGRVGDAVVAHMTANALIAASVLGFGWWDLWL